MPNDNKENITTPTTVTVIKFLIISAFLLTGFVYSYSKLLSNVNFHIFHPIKQRINAYKLLIYR